MRSSKTALDIAQGYAWIIVFGVVGDLQRIQCRSSIPISNARQEIKSFFIDFDVFGFNSFSEQLHDHVNVQLLQHDNLAATEKGRVQAKGGVLGGGSNQSDCSILQTLVLETNLKLPSNKTNLDVGQKRVLLHLVKAMHLVHEEQSFSFEHSNLILCGLDGILHLSHVGGASRELDKSQVWPFGLGLVSNDIGQTRLSTSGGSPQYHVRYTILLNQVSPHSVVGHVLKLNFNVRTLPRSIDRSVTTCPRYWSRLVGLILSAKGALLKLCLGFLGSGVVGVGGDETRFRLSVAENKVGVLTSGLARPWHWDACWARTEGGKFLKQIGHSQVVEDILALVWWRLPARTWFVSHPTSFVVIQSLGQRQNDSSVEGLSIMHFKAFVAEMEQIRIQLHPERSSRKILQQWHFDWYFKASWP